MKKLFFPLLLCSMQAAAVVPPADVAAVIDHSVQSIWAVNELTNAKIDSQNLKGIVDITFPCKIVYQTDDMAVHVLVPDSSKNSDQCVPSAYKNAQDVDYKKVPKSFYFCLLYMLGVSLIINIFFAYHFFTNKDRITKL